MFNISVTIEGKTPLLQNKLNPQDLFNKIRKKLTYEEEVKRERVVKKAHINSAGKLVQPAETIRKSIELASAYFPYKGQKMHKTLLQGNLAITPELIEHKYQDWEVDESIVKDTTAKLVCRPRFDKWELDFFVACPLDSVEPSTLKDILEYAGNNVGLGSRRKSGYGKFRIIKWEIQKSLTK